MDKYVGEHWSVIRIKEDHTLRFQSNYGDSEYVITEDMSDTADRLMNHYFKDDAYWLIRALHPEMFVIIKGVCYYVEDENSKSIDRGFGGRPFRIRMLDSGEEFTTTNLWHNGDVPEKFREELPDNAEFIQVHM